MREVDSVIIKSIQRIILSLSLSLSMTLNAFLPSLECPSSERSQVMFLKTQPLDQISLLLCWPICNQPSFSTNPTRRASRRGVAASRLPPSCGQPPNGRTPLPFPCNRFHPFVIGKYAFLLLVTDVKRSISTHAVSPPRQICSYRQITLKHFVYWEAHCTRSAPG